MNAIQPIDPRQRPGERRGLRAPPTRACCSGCMRRSSTRRVRDLRPLRGAAVRRRGAAYHAEAREIAIRLGVPPERRAADAAPSCGRSWPARWRAARSRSSPTARSLARRGALPDPPSRRASSGISPTSSSVGHATRSCARSTGSAGRAARGRGRAPGGRLPAPPAARAAGPLRFVPQRAAPRRRRAAEPRGASCTAGRRRTHRSPSRPV